MSVPKQHHSKARQARGRVRYVKAVKNSVSCQKCGASISSHRVCPKCGFYKNREYQKTIPTLSRKKSSKEKK